MMPERATMAGVREAVDYRRLGTQAGPRRGCWRADPAVLDHGPLDDTRAPLPEALG
jgi:hypothetical protein